jgi:hypothetical protein
MNKTNLPLITKKILDADFVLVYWEDITSNSAWLNIHTAMESKSAICVSTGWLILKDKEKHILASDMNFEDNGTLGDVGNITTIPTQNVIKVKRIKL